VKTASVTEEIFFIIIVPGVKGQEESVWHLLKTNIAGRPSFNFTELYFPTSNAAAAKKLGCLFG
jgi:hypothetical protein